MTAKKQPHLEYQKVNNDFVIVCPTQNHNIG